MNYPPVTFGSFTPAKLSNNAKIVMTRRICAKDEHGDPIETPDEVFRRVATDIARAEGTEGTYNLWANRFYQLMASLKFLPNSPTLVNAGRDMQQLSACFVLPVPDSIEGIFETVKQTAMIHKSGGGTGFSFSRLRPAGSRVGSTMGVASGPVSFMRVFDAATEAIKQGGTRRGANMGVLSIEHPDIREFIQCKADLTSFQNFNISVAVTDAFMTKLNTGDREAQELWDLIALNAWKSGDPGLIFIDTVNKSPGSNPVPQLGPIEASNPCGEQMLYANDSCNLGSLDVSKYYNPGILYSFDYDQFQADIKVAVRFLDNVVTQCNYPTLAIQDTSRSLRRIGLGIMGWADLLIKMGIVYGSDESIKLANILGKFLSNEARAASAYLGGVKGHSILWGSNMRNCSVTTIAPTGTISIIAGCSSGIEPLFAFEFTRSHYLDKDDPSKRTELNETYQRDPGTDAAVFVSAHDVNPFDHLMMQAVFQENIDNAVSKTINLPNSATPQLISSIYKEAYGLGCKGITVYRDGCKSNQVLSTEHTYNASDSTLTSMTNQYTSANLNGDPTFGEVIGGRTAPSLQGVTGRLPDERQSITHRFQVGEQKGYITVGMYPDGRPGELFITASKSGSTTSGLYDALGRAVSIMLQHGVGTAAICKSMGGARFEPAGMTNNPNIPTASSVTDYVFRWIEHKFLSNEPVVFLQPVLPQPEPEPEWPTYLKKSGDLCPECGGMLNHTEGCAQCPLCFYSRC